MYKEVVMAVLKCDVCGQPFDQKYDNIGDVRHAAFMGGWVTYHDRDICGSCLFDILNEHFGGE